MKEGSRNKRTNMDKGKKKKKDSYYCPHFGSCTHNVSAIVLFGLLLVSFVDIRIR